MRKLFSIPFFLCAFALFFISCEKENQVTGTPSPLISLDDIRLMYKDSPVVLKPENMLGASYITGIVISDPSNGNVPEGKVIVQSYRRKQLRGIVLALGNTTNQYNAGDSIVVKVDGSTLERINGTLQLSGITESEITKISMGNEQKVNIATGTFSAITSKMYTYESTLVQLSSAIADDIAVGQTFGGNITLTDGGNTLQMHTEATASFASEKVPGLGNYTGIMVYSSDGLPTLWLRSSDDYEGQSLDPYVPKALYQNFPEGWENAIGGRKGGYTAGSMEVYPSGEWLMDRCYTLSSANVSGKTDTYSLMMQSGQVAGVEMNFNLPYGASKLSFDYGPATSSDTKLPIVVKVEYSKDSGNTWEQLEDDIIVTSAGKSSKEYTLDIKGSVRFRITKDNAPARLFIDQISINQN